jgi:hypothetical protein
MMHPDEDFGSPGYSRTSFRPDRLECPSCDFTLDTDELSLFNMDGERFGYLPEGERVCDDE